jgi:hypothetical protein
MKSFSICPQLLKTDSSKTSLYWTPDFSELHYRYTKKTHGHVQLRLSAVLWSRSRSHKEPELLARAGAGILKFWLPAPVPGSWLRVKLN